MKATDYGDKIGWLFDEEFKEFPVLPTLQNKTSADRRHIMRGVVVFMYIDLEHSKVREIQELMSSTELPEKPEAIVTLVKSIVESSPPSRISSEDSL